LIRPNGEGLVFLLSTPRAGSTLLAAMLGSHSRIACPPEPWLLLPLLACGSSACW
jgi:O-antigen biosynthesis protein